MKKLFALIFSIFITASVIGCQLTPITSSKNSEDSTIITNSSHNNSSSNSSTQNHSSSTEQSPDDNADIFEITLDKSNSSNVQAEEDKSFSKTIEGIDFYYSNTFYNSSADGHVNLNKNGYITNVSPLGDIRYVTVNYDFINAPSPEEQNLYGFGYLKYRIGRNYIDNPNDYGTNVTTVGEDFVIDLSEYAGDYFISFWSPRKVEITSITCTYAEDEYIRDYSDFTIQIFSTNDIHGQIKNADGYPGLSALTEKMQSLASQDDAFNLFIDQGDLYQGTAEAGLSDGYNLDDFLLQNGYESTTLGNHEFDWGENRIKEHVSYSPVTILANNVRYDNTGLSPEWATPFKLVSRNGVKIGIIGAVGDVESSISASKINNISFLTGDALTNQIKSDAQTLKDMGADFIILSLHDGGTGGSNNASSLSYYNISKLSKTYVDLVLEGHSHQRYKFYDSKGVWHLQNGGNGSSFFLSKLKCTYSNGEYTVSMSTTQDTPYYYTATSSAKNPAMEEVDAWYTEYKYGKKQSEVVGKNVPYMYSSDFEDLTAKLYYEYGLEKTKNSPYELALGGGFIRTRTPYNLNGGTTTYGHIFNLLPFDNDLVLCSISGYYLKSKFLQTSNSDYHVYANITASQVDNTKTYYIITDSYTSDYASNRLTVVENYTIKDGLYARDLVAEYLKSTYLK